MKVSVVTPVYKVSAFIERCAEALMRQTFDDIEFIFVDDASPDDSRAKLEAVIAEYPERNVRILTHERNLGLPSARKTGVTAAAGDYIYNCDGDDWPEETLVEKLYSAAVANDADLVYCDFFLSFEHSERYMHNPVYSTPDEMLRKGFLSGACKWNVWNKLFRRSLYDGVEFPVDHRKGGEDMIVIGMLGRAKSIAYVPEALYHYVKTNAEAISEGFSEQRLIDVRYNADSAMRSLADYPSDISREIALFKLNVKLPFLLSDDVRKYKVWSEWYPEANAFIWQNTELPFRTKLLEWMASKGLWCYVRMYFKLVYKVIYGKVFK